MTWSLIARDEDGSVGLIVSSKFFACGAVVPYVGAQVAVASQAFCNPVWGTEGRTRLASGEAPQAVLDDLVARDAGQAIRQAHMMGADGTFAAHTGAECVDWAGHLIKQDHSVAGNMLAGSQVLEATSAAYSAHSNRPFAERLIRAMQAGQDAGGDKRGRQAAGLVIHKGEDHPWLDLRADDHSDPLAELARLWEVAQERYVHFTKGMPTAAQFSGMPEREGIDAAIAAAEAARKAAGRPSRSAAVEIE
ncbi:major pilin protein FimA [Rhodobacteraceae bacterium KLH11]|nr:major pilin protein FimA [Rhodobacteraceae bacterium KLH11]